MIHSEHGAHWGARNGNIKDRGNTTKECGDYAGCHTNAGKSFLGVLIKCPEAGEFRKPNPETSITKDWTLTWLKDASYLAPSWVVNNYAK
jgi:hypothetical protein